MCTYSSFQTQTRHDQPWSSASLFLFISFDTLCCAASCFASSTGTLDTGLLEISAEHKNGRRDDQSDKLQGKALEDDVPCLRSYLRRSKSAG